jgi:hypothetical protein
LVMISCQKLAVSFLDRRFVLSMGTDD